MAMRWGHRERRLMKEVRLVLLNDWNPIGFTVPDDEYDSYAPRVLGLLLAGADRDRLTEHLYMLEMTEMGLPGDREKCSRAAEKLLGISMSV